MVRIKHSVATKKGRKRVLRKTKGQFGHRKNRYRQAKRGLIKAMRYSYRDRKVRKRDFRRLWITRINAACRENDIMYSRFIKGLIDAKVSIDRKVLAELAVNDTAAFKELVKLAKENLPTVSAKKSATAAKA